MAKWSVKISERPKSASVFLIYFHARFLHENGLFGNAR
jgi:hypothetical protein